MEETPFDLSLVGGDSILFIIGWRRLHLIYHWLEETPFDLLLVGGGSI
jgi:hypothetical protein